MIEITDEKLHIECFLYLIGITDEMEITISTYQLKQMGSPKCTEELFSSASGSNVHVSSYTHCAINRVRFLIHDRDNWWKTPNRAFFPPGVGNNPFFCGQLE